MKDRFALRLFLGLVVTLSAGAFALAQSPGVEPGAGPASGPGVGPGFGDHRPPMEKAFRFAGAHGQFWNNPKIVEKLQLTDEQRKEMDQILLSHREQLIDLRAAEQKAELAMEPLMGADQPNESAILAQVDKIAAARAELEKANARFLLEIRAKLTPDQWKQVQTFQSSPMMHHPWGQGGPTPQFHAPDGPDSGAQGAPPTPPPGGPFGDE
jgi:periplasmic protein CpxP/Spy